MCEFVYLHACVKLCIEHAGVATIFFVANLLIFLHAFTYYMFKPEELSPEVGC